MAEVSNVPEATTALQSQDQTFCHWAGPRLWRNAVRNAKRLHLFLVGVVPVTMGTCGGVALDRRSGSAELVWVVGSRWGH